MMGVFIKALIAAVLDILAYCPNPHAWSPGVRYAAELAANLGASLTGLHVSAPWPSREPLLPAA